MWLKRERPTVSTIVSFSDPSVGLTGALYRACNWRYALTWHALRPPPTGNGSWTEAGNPQAVKHRWVYALRADPRRACVLAVNDSALADHPMAYRDTR